MLDLNPRRLGQEPAMLTNFVPGIFALVEGLPEPLWQKSFNRKCVGWKNVRVPSHASRSDHHWQLLFQQLFLTVLAVTVVSSPRLNKLRRKK